MNRAALLAAGLLTLAACSSGGEAEPPPPLDTEAPTTTVEPPPTEAPETTTTTTTTVAETTTFPETTRADTTTEAKATPESDAVVFDRAFEGYRQAWAVRRSAILDPSNADFRMSIDELYVDNANKAEIIAFLDSLLASAENSVEDPDNPNSVELIDGLGFAVDGSSALLLVCEVLNEDLVDAGTGEVTFSDPYSYTVQVSMRLVEDLWRIESESVDKEFPNRDSCAG